MLYSSSVDFLECFFIVCFGFFFTYFKLILLYLFFPRMSKEIPRWSRMIPTNQQGALPAASDATIHAERTLAGITQCPNPPTRGIMSKPCTSWQQARADLLAIFSYLMDGINDRSQLPGERMRGHRHKPSRGRFLLEVRQDFSPWECWNEGKRGPGRLRSLSGFGEMQNWNG